MIFNDPRWEKNYASYDRSFVLKESVLFKLRNTIKELL
ncbi:MAG: hypothetical protein S4CHLAM45_04220 [Chlamydiales bacterium]|nr:hypothetical protein [Chlamydiales bacterium]MCH9622538.1 hypothetical protein [Chlamydiales bacterium]